MAPRRSLLLIFVVFCHIYASAQSPSPLRTDQAGYYLNGPKIASWISEGPAKVFRVLTVPGNKTVFQGKSSGPVASTNSSLKVHTLDFSPLKRGHLHDLRGRWR